MVSEIDQPLWAALQRGEFIIDAAEAIGTCSVKASSGWSRREGFILVVVVI